MSSDISVWTIFIVKSFVRKINKEKFEELVKNDYSLLKYVLDHPNNKVIFETLKTFHSLIKIEHITERNVIKIFKDSRPELLEVLHYHPEWLKTQINQIVQYLKHTKI